LTISAGGAFAQALAASKIQWYEPTVSNCGAATGSLMSVFGGSSIILPGGTAQMPGDGFVRVGRTGTVTTGDGLTPAYTPTLGTCANGTMATGSDNYEMEIDFAGANSTCAILFGGPTAPATRYFATAPRCTASLNNGAANNYVQPITVSSTGITIVPNAALGAGQAVYVHCLPQISG
jgi:hypothetical protein